MGTLHVNGAGVLFFVSVTPNGENGQGRGGCTHSEGVEGEQDGPLFLGVVLVVLRDHTWGKYVIWFFATEEGGAFVALADVSGDAW